MELLGLLRLCEGWTLAESHLAGEGGSRFDRTYSFVESQLDHNTVQTQDTTVQLWLMLVLNVLLFEYLKEKERKERKGGRRENQPSEHASKSGALRSPEFQQDGGVGVGEVGGSSSSSSSFPSRRESNSAFTWFIMPWVLSIIRFDTRVLLLKEQNLWVAACSYKHALGRYPPAPWGPFLFQFPFQWLPPSCPRPVPHTSFPGSCPALASPAAQLSSS